MAKKAAKVVTEVVVPEALVGLDISGLNKLIVDAQARIKTLDSGTREERIASFKNTDYYKTFKQKVSAIKAEIKAALKEGKSTFEATIRFSVQIDQLYSVEDGIYRGYNDLFEYDVNAGKITGEGLTKKQKESIEEAVSNYANGMCDDGVEIFFPKLREKFQAFEEKVSDLNDELNAELEKHHLTTDNIHE